jgi:hypothetical protein
LALALGVQIRDSLLRSKAVLLEELSLSEDILMIEIERRRRFRGEKCGDWIVRVHASAADFKTPERGIRDK